jgi:hypothetical protein
MKLPTFLIIGANKGGTTTLYYHARVHPNVFMPAMKEPHFFAEKSMLPELRTVADYAQMFDAATPDQFAIGEASTGYLGSLVAPSNVHRVIPGVRLIAILRDPAERTWSSWRWTMRNHHFDTRLDPVATLKDRLDSRYIRGGRYKEALLRWLKLFPPEQLKVLLLEDLANAANAVMADFYGFIGVEPIPVDAELHANAAPEREKPIPAALRNWLVDYYRDDISFVEELLGRDLSHWRRPAG